MVAIAALIPSLLSAVGSGLEFFGNRDAEEEQIELLKRQYGLQESVARQLIELAKASKTDAYGNKTYYTEAGGFEQSLDPRVKALINAQLIEQNRNLTTDALRNRESAEREENLADTAALDYGTVRNEWLYGDKPDEKQMQADLLRELGLANRETDDKAKAIMGRQALRMNQGELIPKIFKQGQDVFDLEERLLRAKREGSELYRAADAHRSNKLGSELSNFYSRAQTNPRQIQYNTLGETVDNNLDSSNDDLTNALKSASNIYGGSMASSLATTTGGNNPWQGVSSFSNDIGTLLAKLMEKPTSSASATPTNTYKKPISLGYTPLK